MRHDGSLQVRGNRWIGLYYVHGKRKFRTLGPVTLSRRAAQALLDDIIEADNNEQAKDWRFMEFTNNIVFPLLRGKWKPSTAFTTEERFRLYLYPHIGNEPLKALDRARLQALLADHAKRLSHSVVAHLRWDLSLSMKVAVAEGIITKNPAALLYVPRHAKRATTRVLSHDELATIIDKLALRERLIVRLAGQSGMRPGEIEGLKWSDLKHDGLRITRRIYRRLIDTPKTHHSVRNAVISASTREDLTAWTTLRLTQNPDAWIFPSENPKHPVSLSNVWLRNIRPQLQPQGLGWVNYQVLRRTASSLLRSIAGADPKLVADQLGHTTDVNLNVYTKTFSSEQQAALDKLDKALEANRSTNKKTA